MPSRRWVARLLAAAMYAGARRIAHGARRAGRGQPRRQGVVGRAAPGRRPRPGRRRRRRAPAGRRSRRSSAAPACRRRASPSRCARSTRRRAAAALLPCRPAVPARLDRQARDLARRARPARPAAPLAHDRATRPAPVSDGRLRGDLVIIGGPVGLTGNELRRWFVQMRDGRPADDLRQHRPRRRRPAARARSEAGRGDRGRARPRRADRRPHLQPRQARGLGEAGRRANAPRSCVKPRPANVLVVNDVLMGGGCSAWASWKTAGRDRVRPAAAALGARPLEARTARPRTSPTSGRRRRCACSPRPASRRRRRFPRRAWSPSSLPRPAAACAAASSSAMPRRRGRAAGRR